MRCIKRFVLFTGSLVTVLFYFLASCAGGGGQPSPSGSTLAAEETDDCLDVQRLVVENPGIAINKPDADLEGCDLAGANLGANLTGADLTRVIVDDKTYFLGATCPDGDVADTGDIC